MRRLFLAGLAIFVVGCGGGGHDAAPTNKAAAVAPRPRDEQVIRAWNRAVNSGHYRAAGALFAPGAIVSQNYVLPLPNHKVAAQWNSGFPCRADITFVRFEKLTTLAGFHLREGPRGDCKKGGSAKVRFTIRDGLIQRWQQVLEPDSGRQTTPTPAT
jgi:hypothetical protein